MSVNFYFFKILLLDALVHFSGCNIFGKVVYY